MGKIYETSGLLCSQNCGLENTHRHPLANPIHPYVSYRVAGQ
jgi:hypothetical protein